MEFNSEFAKSIFCAKYLLDNETEPIQGVERLSTAVSSIYPELKQKSLDYISNKWFIPAGGIWRAAGNPTHKTSFVNCTTLIPPEDNLESIFKSLYYWAKFAAYGQGEGVDISNLRPRGSKLHNTARSSTGAVSFMSVYDAVLQVIAQKGRRGASLISIRDTHPDFESFCKIKDGKGKIESANISLLITDAFMNAVMNDQPWLLNWISENGKEDIRVERKAKDLFNLLCEHTWQTGDPGVLFWDTSKRESNSDVLGYPVVSTNACSEQVLDPFNICLLSSINLSKFKEFGQAGFEDLIEFGIRFLDACLQLEYVEKRSPIPEQRKLLIDMPRVGLGITGFADQLINNQIVYGSKESISFAESTVKKLVEISYITSYNIAKSNGKSFTKYDKEVYKKSNFVKKLLDENIIAEKYLDYQAHVCKNTIAPVGTGSIIGECGGSGIEPIFSKYMVRRERATTSEWKEWFIFNPLVEQKLKEKGLEINKTNADGLKEDYWICSYNLDQLKKVELMARFQKYIDSSISVTYNLPETATIEDIKQIYINGWQNGLKGVAIFREGSKDAVLITEANYDKIAKNKKRILPSRPIELPCNIHELTVNKEKHIVLVGLLNDKPYEVFVTKDNENKIDLEQYKKGIIRKVARGKYDLIVENGETKTMISDINKTFNDVIMGTLSRFISMSLRHSVPLSFCVDQLSKSENFSSFERAVSRVLKKYIPDNEEVLSEDGCPRCGKPMVYSSGCRTCSDVACGYSRCD